MTRIYLDHNATAPLRPEAREVMLKAFDQVGNASAINGHGRAAAKFVNEARESVGLAMGVCSQDIIFTGSGTESDNTAIHSAIQNGTRRILISGMDHPATFMAARNMDVAHEKIPVSQDGVTDMGWLRERLVNWDKTDGPPFISMVAANSETGAVQDIETAADLVHAAGGYILVDAVQALGKYRWECEADYIAVSAHKIGGPQGVGALYVASDAPFHNLISGGGQERRRRAGTCNTAGIAGFGAAARVCEHSVDHTEALRDRLEAELRAMEPELFIFSEGTKRLPNTSFFAVPDAASQTLLMGLDLENISVSTGTACASGKVGASRAVTAMGLLDKSPKGAIRMSLGYTSTMRDVEAFLAAWAKIRKKKVPVFPDSERGSPSTEIPAQAQEHMIEGDA